MREVTAQEIEAVAGGVVPIAAAVGWAFAKGAFAGASAAGGVYLGYQFYQMAK